MDVTRIFPLNKIHEGMEFVFRADALNVFNTPNLLNPLRTVSPENNINGGEITSTTGSNTVAGPVGRRLQLSGTIYF
jgi:hypothetical protein